MLRAYSSMTVLPNADSFMGIRVQRQIRETTRLLR
jgi:hypothetical protein